MKLILILLIGFTYTTASAQLVDSIDCSMIEREYDEFDKETTLRTPLLEHCGLTKVISKKGTFYYLSLDVIGSTVNVGERGVKIILSNNQMLSFPAEKISVDASREGFRYSAFLSVTPTMLQLLKKHKITKFKLFIYDHTQTDNDAEHFRQAVNCISKQNLFGPK